MNVLKEGKGILYLILIFGLALRLYGISFEVPHPDDYITVQGAMHFGPAQITPTGYGLYGLYVWPGLTLVYIQTLIFTIYFFLGQLFGVFPDIESFRTLYFTESANFYLIGRVINVCFSVGTIWILYYLAKKLYNNRVGLLASLFLGVSFIHSFHSQFIRPDVPSTFFIVLTIMCCLMILEQRETKYYIWSGVLSGIAIATKFTSGILFLSLLAAHWMAESKKLLANKDRSPKGAGLPLVLTAIGGLVLAASMLSVIFDVSGVVAKYFSPDGELNHETTLLLHSLIKIGVILGGGTVFSGVLLAFAPTARRIIYNLLFDRKLFLAMIVALITFAVFDPLFFLHFKLQIQILLTDANYLGKNSPFVGVDSLGFFQTGWWYFTGPLSWGLGPHFVIMAALGLLLALARNRREDQFMLVFPLIYFTVISFGKFKWERYAITLMPFIALYSASFLNTVIDRVPSKWVPTKTRNMILPCIAIGMIATPTYNILRYDYLLTLKDTRVIAKEWVETNITPGSKIGQDAYTGELSDDLFQITKKFSLSDEHLTYYRENGYQFLLVSDTQYKRYFAEPEKYQKNIEFYKSLFTEGSLIREIKPRDDLWPRPNERFTKYHIHVSPTIKIYKLCNI